MTVRVEALAPSSVARIWEGELSYGSQPEGGAQEWREQSAGWRRDGRSAQAGTQGLNILKAGKCVRQIRGCILEFAAEEI